MSTDGVMNFVRTTLNPEVGGMPPNLSAGTTFGKIFTVDGSFNVNDAHLASDGDRISSHSGLILWFPLRGVDHSLTRYGIVPNGTLTRNMYTISEEYGNSYSEYQYRFQYNGEVALPYEHSANIQISPDVSDDFSTVRLIAGAFRLESTTIPIGSTALNGWLSGGVINDTRDVCDKDGVAYPLSSILQQTMTPKDGLQKISVRDAIVSVVGPDISPNFQTPNDDFVYGMAGDKNTYPGGPPTEITITGWTHGSSIRFDSRWYSPYDIAVVGTPTSPDIPLATRIKPLNVNAQVIIDTEFHVSPVRSVVAQIMSFNIQIMYSHVWAYIDSTGTVQYSIDRETDSRVFSPNTWPTVPGSKSVPDLRAVDQNFQFKAIRANQRVYHRKDNASEFSDESIYIGTLIHSEISNVSGPDILNGTFGGYLTHSFTSTNIYRQGELGPARVIRWDDVGDGQSLSLRGKLLVQCVPEGTIAPYVSVSQNTNDMSQQMNVYPLLNALYNGRWDLFRRIYSGTAYDAAVAAVHKLSLGQLASTGGNGDASVQTAAHAAGGFLTELGTIGGTLLGSAFGDGAAGGAIGGMLGDKIGGIASNLFSGHRQSSSPSSVHNAQPPPPMSMMYHQPSQSIQPQINYNEIAERVVQMLAAAGFISNKRNRIEEYDDYDDGQSYYGRY